MSVHRRDPFRKVANAVLKDDDHGRFWLLTLECGHEDTRPIRYDPSKNNAGRGGARKKIVRSVEDAMPPPERVRCDQCPRRR